MSRFVDEVGTSHYPPRPPPKRSRRTYHISCSSSDSEPDRQTRSDSTQYVVPSEKGDTGNSTQFENSVVLSHTVLDCPICFNSLAPLVYQCVNGHLLCGLCSKKINQCPSCSTPIGSNRCNAIEKILEVAKVSCRNRQYGCTVKITYSEKLEHEKLCIPCSCPHECCNYVAMSSLLYRHFSAQHSSSVHEFRINFPTIIRLPKDINRVFLQERPGSTFFVLNRSVEPLGSLFSVVCVALPSSAAEYTYRLTAQAGHKKIYLTSSVAVAPKCSAQPPKQNCLLITSDFAYDLEHLDLQLLIRRLE